MGNTMRIFKKMTGFNWRPIGFAALIACILVSEVSAQVPMQFAYQGRLTDSNNVPVTGVVTCDFQVIKGGTDSDPASGTPVYHETAPVTTDVNGFFSHVLGQSTNKIGLSSFGPDGSARHLEVSIGGVTFTRRQIVSVPFAMAATSIRRPSFSASSKTRQTTKDATVLDFSRAFDPDDLFDGRTFTAPRSGVYFFTSSISFESKTSGQSDDIGIQFRIQKNPRPVDYGRLVCNPDRDAGRKNGNAGYSTSCVIPLAAGEQVSVVIDSVQSYTTNRADAISRSFSGFMVSD